MSVSSRSAPLTALIGLPVGLLGTLCTFGPSGAEFRGVMSGPQQYADRFGADALAVIVVGGLLWTIALWLTLACLATLAASIPGAIGSVARSVSSVITPAVLRRAAVTAVGIGIITAAPAHASSLPAASTAPATGISIAYVQGDATDDPDLDWPAASPDTPAPTTDVVVVQSGDCLWDIVADRLPPEASATEIANEVVRWWKANEDLIGDDPNLLLPGQALQPPTATS